MNFLLPLLGLLFVIAMFSGWITNIIWTFNQSELVPVLLGILGALVFPIGALHGIYTWF